MQVLTTYLSEIADNLAPNPMSAAVAGILGVVGVALLLARRKRLAGTTLIAPWCWALVSLVSVSGCEIVLGLTDFGASRLHADALRLAAAVTTFCPVMAQLGAKRPQDRAWQLIVFSLWVVLAMPVAEAFVHQRSEQLNVRDARILFLWVLVAMGLLNNLPTRFGFSALLFAMGQLCLFSNHLPFVPMRLGTVGVMCGLGLLVSALGIVVAGWPRPHVAASPEDRVWLDFRDMFGMMWALRVADRLNTASESFGWNVVLRWYGFRDTGGNKVVTDEVATGVSQSGGGGLTETGTPTGGADDGQTSIVSPEVRRDLHTSLRNLLRRFVSSEWIATRLDRPPRQ